MSDINDAVTSVAPTADYPAYAPYEPQHAWSQTPDYIDTPAEMEPTASWIRQHWKTAAIITEAAAAIIGVGCWIVSLQHGDVRPDFPQLTAPQTTVIFEPAPPIVSTTTVTPPPATLPSAEPREPASEPSGAPHWSSDPDTQLFTPDEDEQLAERLATQHISATQDVINTAHDACIMIQDGDLPSEVDRTVAATSDTDLWRASLIVANAQLSYPTCYKNGNRK